MRCLTSHRIFVRSSYGAASLSLWMIEVIYLRDSYLRIVNHHRLVHTIEGKLSAIVAEESAFMYAKLVAMNTLSVYNLA